MEKSSNPYDNLFDTLTVENKEYKFVNLNKLDDKRIKNLPYSIRILLEQAVRNCDNFNVLQSDVEKILDWEKTSIEDVEIPFKPARVLLQDFTGVPAVVDLASMRDIVVELGKDPNIINPIIQTDLVVDHSIQVDSNGKSDSLKINQDLEYERNAERFKFLKWGQNNIKNFSVVPPGSGIVHQINLEYLAKVIYSNENLLYPDTLVGADSHTTMINGLGVLGWGVGGIEAEAAMLGQCISLVLPQVVGVKLVGELPEVTTATDLVLTITEVLRKKGVVGKFVEFFGKGCKNLSLANRATIANMAPEYGATMGYFPVDKETLNYLTNTARNEHLVKIVEEYCSKNMLFTTYSSDEETIKYNDVVEVDLSKIVPCVSGPKRPQDRVDLSKLKNEFDENLTKPVNNKCFGLEKSNLSSVLTYNNKEYTLNNGSILIAAITSCTNTSNPSVMLSAGLLAKKACELGLKVPEYIKCSLSPGSWTVSLYLDDLGYLGKLKELGFALAGFGCMTCIGNSGEFDSEISDFIAKNSEMVLCSVLSGNRNFEGRVHNNLKANYLCSPPLVVAFALAGRVNIDFEKEPIGVSNSGKEVFLSDIWPSRKEIDEIIERKINSKLYETIYKKVFDNHYQKSWNSIENINSKNYQWNKDSTYIKEAPFFKEMLGNKKDKFESISKARCLLNLGDSITTDHISPAGNIAGSSIAAKFLNSKGVEKKDFNSYGSRRGNYEIMARGTFGNVRLVNKLAKSVGSKTNFLLTNEEMDIYTASQKYQENNIPLIVLAGKEYGSGSSRDWAAKGPVLLGVKAVIAESFERIHRSNLAGMGILPLQYLNNQSAETLKLTGLEEFDIILPEKELVPKMNLTVKVDSGKESEKQFEVLLRLDTAPEIEYYRCNGILQYVLRKMISN